MTASEQTTPPPGPKWEAATDEQIKEWDRQCEEGVHAFEASVVEALIERIERDGVTSRIRRKLTPQLVAAIDTMSVPQLCARLKEAYSDNNEICGEQENQWSQLECERAKNAVLLSRIYSLEQEIKELT